LSIALWRPTSAHAEQLAGLIEEPGRVQAAGQLEGGLAQSLGQRGEQAAVDQRPGRGRGGVDADLVDRALAADAAGGGRVEGPRAGIVQKRPRDLDHVALELGPGPGLAWAVDQALAVEEAERQFLVVAGRPHRHGERVAVDADLERLLDCDLVLASVVEDALVHSRIHAATISRPAIATPAARVGATVAAESESESAGRILCIESSLWGQVLRVILGSGPPSTSPDVYCERAFSRPGVQAPSREEPP